MRANAQRAAQKAKQRSADQVNTEALPPEPEGTDSDSLDFSSEFSNPDMGLSDEGGFTKMLDWKTAIEEEEEEKSRREDDEEGEPEEWRSGGWGEKEESEEQEAPPSAADDDESPPPADEAKPLLRPIGQSPILPSKAAEGSASAQAPAKPQTPPTPPPVAVMADASTEQPLGVSWLTSSPSSAEPVHRPANLAPVELPARLRPQAQFALPPSGQLSGLEPRLAEAARRLITNPPHEPGYEECVRLLARFGLGALSMCGRAKVRVEILDEAGFAAHPDLLALGLRPEETPSDGAYLVAERKVLIDRRSLTGQPRFFHPALYYFAHAFDHAQGGETFSSRKAAAVVACYESSVRALNGFDFIDELAAADPVRYFARSVAVYLGKDDCSDPLWSHQDLFDFDRSMYDYLQYLFSRLKA